MVRSGQFRILILLAVVASALAACPQNYEFAPCTCNPISESFKITCNEIPDFESVRPVFQQDFTGLPCAGIAFTNLFFETFQVFPADLLGTTFQTRDFAVESAANVTLFEYGFLDNSRDILEKISIRYTGIQYFPFSSLERFFQIYQIDIEGNFNLRSIEALPLLPALSLLYIKNNVNLVDIAPFYGPFAGLAVASITGNSKFTRIPSDWTEGFAGIGEDYSLSLELWDNGITIIEDRGLTALGSLATLFLDRNPIEDMANDTFASVRSDGRVSLSGLFPTTLYEGAFDPLLSRWIAEGGSGFVNVDNPSMTCDCSLAWLVRQPEKLARIQGQACCGNINKCLKDLTIEDLGSCL